MLNIIHDKKNNLHRVDLRKIGGNFKSFKDKKVAQLEAKKLWEQHLEQNYVPRNHRVTGQEALNQWIEEQTTREAIGESERKHKLASAALLLETQIAGTKFADWDLGELIYPPLRTPKTITRDIFNGPMSINRHAGGKTSVKTRQNYLQHFKQMFKYFVECAYIKSNPLETAKIEKPQDYNEDMKATRLNPEIIHSVRSNIDDDFKLLYYTAIATGMRQGEQRALTWNDVDFNAGTIKISKAVKVAKHGEEIGVPKTKGSFREIPMSEDLSKALKEEKLKRGMPKENSFVFSNRNNMPISGKTFRTKLKNAIKKSSVDAFTWHDLRHFFASILFDKFEGDYYIVSQLLGHESVEFTKKQYVHWFKDEDRNNRVRESMAQAGI